MSCNRISFPSPVECIWQSPRLSPQIAEYEQHVFHYDQQANAKGDRAKERGRKHAEANSRPVKSG